MLANILNKIRNLTQSQKDKFVDREKPDFNKIHGSIFLLSEVFSFYSHNFFKIFTIGSFYFAITSVAVVYGTIYFDSPSATLFIFIPLFLIYLFTISKIITDGGGEVGESSIYALLNFIPLSITIFISVLTILGMSVVSFIPEFAILSAFQYSKILNILGGAVFVIFSLIALIYYSMFLLAAVDEEKYGFRALATSKDYVSTDFRSYLSRFIVGATLIPIAFYTMLYAVHGIFVAIEVINAFFNVNYDIFKLQNTIQKNIVFYQFYIRGQSVLLEAWFVKMVFVIPIYITYSSFLYFSLSGRNLTKNKIDISFSYKFILGAFAIVGALSILVLLL
jgi:hypothetical protein